jgi:hypothetical protein
MFGFKNGKLNQTQVCIEADILGFSFYGELNQFTLLWLFFFKGCAFFHWPNII